MNVDAKSARFSITQNWNDNLDNGDISEARVIAIPEAGATLLTLAGVALRLALRWRVPPDAPPPG